MKSILLLGLQVDLFPLGAAEINGSEQILPVINNLLPDYGHVVAAKFSHPTDHKMFVANYPWRRPGQEIDLMGEKILLKNYYCIKNTFGAELTIGFDHHAITFTAWMGTDHLLLPHSAFFDERQQRDTGLNIYLTKNKIDEIHLAGLPFEEVVFKTAMDGMAAGFVVKVIKDGVKEKSAEKATEAMKSLKKEGVEFI